MTRIEKLFREQKDVRFRLKPVPKSGIAVLAKKRGPLPRDYTTLLARLGSGSVTCGEDVDSHRILGPREIDRCFRDYRSWLVPEAVLRAKRVQKLDVDRMFPILVTPDWTAWVLLAGQKPFDRVFFFSHDWEQYQENVDLFAGPMTVYEFFDHFFWRARKGDALNGSYDHRFSFRPRRRS